MKSIIFFGLLGNYLYLCPRFEDTDYQSAGRTRRKQAIVTQLVERNLPKVEVAGSSPVYRSKKESCHTVIETNPVWHDCFFCNHRNIGRITRNAWILMD